MSAPESKPRYQITEGTDSGLKRYHLFDCLNPQFSDHCIAVFNFRADADRFAAMANIFESMKSALEFYADPDLVVTGFNRASGSRYVQEEYHDEAKGILAKAKEAGL